jgi:hypothetical protein
MRVILFIIALTLIGADIRAQRDYLLQPEPEVQDDTLRSFNNKKHNSASQGIYLFQKKDYARAVKYLERAFNKHPDEETARYLFYALLYQGQDLEAARFRLENQRYTFVLPSASKGPESVYAEFGPRVAVPPDTVGNMYYASTGGFIRLTDKTRIWQAVSYLRQDFNLGRYQQGEYFAALHTSLPDRWMIKPSLHYIYTGFTTLYNTNREVSYTDTQGTTAPTIYRTVADQVIRYNNPGTAHYLHLSLPASKRIHAFTLEALPSVQLIRSKYRVGYTYTTTGSTDSIRDNEIKGTSPYYETGSGGYDTTELSLIGQLGAGATWKLSLAQKMLTLRAAAFYLFDFTGEKTTAFHAGLTYYLHKHCWLYATWMAKGGLPFSLDAEGQYFNHYHRIRNRESISVQLFPMRQFSPLFTYQYEQQERFLDKSKLNYHSIYLTLKYSL